MRATLKCAEVVSCCADGFLSWKWTEKERLTQDRLDKHKIHNSGRSVGLKDKERTHLFASEKTEKSKITVVTQGACFTLKKKKNQLITSHSNKKLFDESLNNLFFKTKKMPNFFFQWLG